MWFVRSGRGPRGTLYGVFLRDQGVSRVEVNSKRWFARSQRNPVGVIYNVCVGARPLGVFRVGGEEKMWFDRFRRAPLVYYIGFLARLGCIPCGCE